MDVQSLVHAFSLIVVVLTADPCSALRVAIYVISLRAERLLDPWTSHLLLLVPQ